ncbi:peptidase u62, modulator of DNA gyrase, putative [Heliorestis convoluta]|uniref:Peptidase u62, modulator of DNA gyrase, putative n=2 Tax=Heliorestis convoluta TaxID=356322 RepID=A0A5Q2MYU4_9FIRM|nr:peptidase u62, modulator of DNA gyrase, putative [Heliorestis convoluta]
MGTITRKMVELAQRKGAEMSEAYGLDARELSIDVSRGVVETMKLAEDRGIGLRIFKNGRMGYAYTSDLDEKVLEGTVERALANAVWTGEDPYHVLPSKVDRYPQVDTFDPEIGNTSVEAKINLAKEIEAAARASDQRIAITERSSYQDAEYTVSIVNSRGVDASYRGAYCGAYAYLVAEEKGENQTGFALSYGLRFSDINPVKVGQEAAHKAVRMLGAKRIASKRMPVLLDPYVVTQFMGILTPSLTAEAVQKGKSPLAGKGNTLIASPTVTLVDDGRLEGRIASAPFDGEGVPSSRTVLIEEGILKNYLHNSYTARKEGVISTGNGTRGSFRGTPEVGTTNFYLQAGNKSTDELMQDIDYGFYVTEVMGMHTANPISGDFSIGAAGLLIEKGRLTTPIRGVAIAGNLMELLQNIDGIGNDLTFFVGKGAPTVRIKSLPVSGD